jgi:tellurite resistance protein
MKALLASSLVLALSTVAAVPAFAGDHGTFPMKADEFQQKVDARIAKARAHLEDRLQKKQVAADTAKEARAKFDAAAAEVEAAVHKATADGVVTADEAKAVRQVARALHPHKKDHEGSRRS